MRSKICIWFAYISITMHAANVHSDNAQDIFISNIFAEETLPNISARSIHFIAENKGSTDIFITSASSPVSEEIQLRSFHKLGSLAASKKIERILIKAGESAKFDYLGYHLKFIGLKHVLKSGTKESLKIRFADGSSKTFEVPIVNINVE